MRKDLRGARSQKEYVHCQWEDDLTKVCGSWRGALHFISKGKGPKRSVGVMEGLCVCH